MSLKYVDLTSPLPLFMKLMPRRSMKLGLFKF